MAMAGNTLLSTLAREIRFWRWQRQARRLPPAPRRSPDENLERVEPAWAAAAPSVRRPRAVPLESMAARRRRERLDTKAS
jgi:hypothetical protein